MSLSPGQILNERYRVAKLLGQGEFGALYRAWDLNANGPVALEEIYETSAVTQQQFTRLASQLVNLRHPGLPRLQHAFGVKGRGHYMVMEFVEGEDLQTLFERAGGPLPEAQILPWITQVCDALRYLHSQDPPIIFGNLKPSSIRVLQPSEQAKEQVLLAGYGAARVFDPSQGASPGTKAVTLGYSPPEQYGDQGIDARADVYALGATMYTLLAGERPAESLRIIRKETPAPRPAHEVNPQVSPSVSAAIQRAMQMDPAERFDNIQAFQEALTGVPAPVKPIPKAPVSERAPKRRRWPVLVGGIVLGVVLLAVLFLVGRSAVSMIAARLATETPLPTATSTITPTQTNTPVPPTATYTATVPPSPTPFLAQIEDDFGALMALVSAVSFQMGSNRGEEAESPQHTVTLDAYYIDVYEVTNSQYAECVQTGACEPPTNFSSPSRSQYYDNPAYEDYPVIYVTWAMAKTYCEWRGGRLPTEAEWEKAARGEEAGRTYPWGEEIDCTWANIWDPQSYCKGDTSEVGSYSNGVSPYGLFDMAGNVWEWVLDWFSETYYASSPSENPTGPDTGHLRVHRGGAWNGAVLQARTTTRGRNLPDKTYNYVGLRCVRSP